MTNLATEQMFRDAAEAEGGTAVSAGARVAHVRLALEKGQAITVDLSQVPEDRRSSLIAVIREMVKLSSQKATEASLPPLSAPTKN